MFGGSTGRALMAAKVEQRVEAIRAKKVTAAVKTRAATLTAMAIVVMARAGTKSQVSQCFGFYTAEFWSSLAYESAE